MAGTRAKLALAASWWLAGLLAASVPSTTDAGFYVCPASCQAMLLPRDMESIDDCLCAGKSSTAVAAKKKGDDVTDPGEFACTGRFTPKPGITEPMSVADCNCVQPYRMDDATGRCLLRKCPRAGNYIKKATSRRVMSLADCTCVAPFVKNDQSGECLADEDDDEAYECPEFASPAANRRPRSFADCHCEFGFVRTPDETCERESQAFVCPKNSVKRADLPLGARPRSFADCLCLQTGEFVRNDRTQACERASRTGERRRQGDTDNDEDNDDQDDDDYDGVYECPPFSRPLAAFPHSVEQCECLPGYGWKTPDMTCVRLSGYTCPMHAYKRDGAKQVEENFGDCECARGYSRDEQLGACVEWFLANDNGCPRNAILKHWPLQSKANCQCIYGLEPAPTPEATTASTPDQQQQKEDEEDPNENKKQIRQRKHRRPTRRPPQPTKAKPPSCRAPPSFNGVTFASCPENAFASNWPVATMFDCMCLDGYDTQPLSEEDAADGDGDGFLCVDKDGDGDDDDTITEPTTTTTATTAPPGGMGMAAIVCTPPYETNPYNGYCRLPLEEVRPPSGRRPSEARGSVLFKGIEYDYVLTDKDVMVIQGDVAIGQLARWPGDGGQNVTTHVLHGYYNAERDHRWPNATLCYEVDASAATWASTVQEAMEHVAMLTNFRFRQCRDNACATDRGCSHDYVSVEATGSSCFSYIGRVGGRQPLGVSGDCGLGNLIHVLLHAVGLHHTIDRIDRDAHIRVAWECIPPSKRSYFIVEELVNATRSALDAPYDFYSIMHHPADAFVQSDTAAAAAANDDADWRAPGSWCMALFPIITDSDERRMVLGTIGQREFMTVTDIHAVWQLYPTLQSLESPFYTSPGTTGESPAPTTTPDDTPAPVFESRLHTQDDLADRPTDVTARQSGKDPKNKRRGSWGRKIASFLGGVLTLVGFGAFVAFAAVEFRKRSLRNGGDTYYSESLLTDKALYD